MHRRLILVLLAILTPTLTACGNVSGDVFVATMGGDVKRGAGVPILLIRASSDFDRVWSQTVAKYQAEMTSAVEAYKDIKGPREYEKEGQAFLAAYRLHSDWVKWAERSLAESAIASVAADSRGHYQLPWVRPGSYYIFSRFLAANRLNFWFVRVSIRPWKNQLDLSNNNMGWPFEVPELT